MFFKLGPEYKWQRDLLRLLVMKEITLKYKRAYLGVLWSLLNPILTAAIYFFAFTVIMRFRMPDYSAYLLSALFPWFWFTASVSMTTNVFISNVTLIKKVLFPRHFLLLSTIAGQFVTFVFSVPILIVLVNYYDKPIGVNWLIGIPILTVIEFFVIYGISLAVSTLNIYFRDIQHLIGIFLQMLFWLTPIIYPLELVPEKYLGYLSLNPMFHLIKCWRDLFLNNTVAWDSVLVSSVTALVVFILGLVIYRHFDKRLDEVL